MEEYSPTVPVESMTVDRIAPPALVGVAVGVVGAYGDVACVRVVVVVVVVVVVAVGVVDADVGVDVDVVVAFCS